MKVDSVTDSSVEMPGRRENASIWDFVRTIVESQGLSLYDMDLPRLKAGQSQNGILRVFIAQRTGGPKYRTADSAVSQGVGIQDCARINKAILNHPSLEEVLPGDYTIEVSSPGINRPLRRAEHFSSAVGEHIKCKFAKNLDGQERNVTVKGLLKSFNDSVLELEQSETGECHTVLLAAVREAKVDFEF